jgi:cytochrome c oxidase subunit 2
VVGKQWMWKIQHPEGVREINELHVPVGRTIKLIMTSQDVIHSFYVPAFRVKQDVLPGRYTTEWFKPTKTGEYHLFCAEYCGTSHSGMVGRIVVMEPQNYEQWLSGGGGSPMMNTGEQLFQQFGCASCHPPGSGNRGPSLKGLYGSPVALTNGQSVKADLNYIRESIVDPQAKITKGYQPIMPTTYRNQISQEQIGQLVEYIRSLGDGGTQAKGGQQ